MPSRKRSAEEKTLCLHELNGTRCRSIPLRDWDFCPSHHNKESLRLAGAWSAALDSGRMRGTSVNATLPDLGKPLDEATREERAALAWLLIYQLRGLDLPKATK